MATSFSGGQDSRNDTSPQRRAAILFLTLVAVAAMSIAAWRFVAASSLTSAIIEGGVAFLIGVAALTPYPSPRRRGESESGRAGQRPKPNDLPIRVLPVGLGVAALALVAAASDDRFPGVAQALGAHGQFALWCGGIALAGWGLSGAPRPRRPALPRRETALLLAILAVALALRVYRLDLPRALVDEWHFVYGTLYFWHTPTPQLLRPIGDLDPFPRIMTYVVNDAVAVFGRTFAALRVVPALVGTATIGAIYLLARELFDRRVALIAAALTATFPPLIHFSRMATISVVDPLFGTLALAFLARALRDGRRSSFVLAGIMLGLTQYFHEAGRLLFPGLVALWIVALLLTRTQIRHIPGTIYGFRVRRPFSWRGLAAGLLAALIVAAPLITIQRTQPEQFKTRLQYAALNNQYWLAVLMTADLRPQLELIRDSTLALVRTTDTTIYYAGSTPLILPPLVPLFLLGMAAIVNRRARLGVGLLVLWMALTILGNSTLVVGTTSVHFLVGLPAATLLMAVGLNEVVTRAAPHRAAPILAALVIAVGVGQTAYYFGPHLDEYQKLLEFKGLSETHDVLLRAATLPPGSDVHVIIGSVDFPFDQSYAQDVLNFLADGLTIDVPAREDVTDSSLMFLKWNVTQAFFVKPYEGGVIARIKAMFPSIGEPEGTPYVSSGHGYVLLRYDPPTRSP